jgi:metallo-beta-lactamase family protein
LKIQFLGAAETVTGSRYLLTQGKTKILVDCGLFQGFKNLRLRNWDAFPIAPSEIDAVLLTHAHLDHSGYIPLLVKNGFRGKVYCTSATRDLCRILLPDSGFLQEEEARFANKHKFSKHKPALPLYTQQDAETSLNSFVAVEWGERRSIPDSNNIDKLEFELHPAGHLFGAASIVVFSGAKSIAFSGDLGRKGDPITRDPNFDLGADDLVVESTYGNRRHLESNPKEELGKVIMRTFERKGTLLIPSFAVGRAQLILHYIRQLKLNKSIPDIPVFLNSPMALKANHVFSEHAEESKMSRQEAREICATATSVTSVEESIALNERKDPVIIIAASGMATGGRVLHHLKTVAPDPKNTILFVGFQAGGTRGEAITKGAKEVKIHGEYWPIRAEVAQLDSMSAHADGVEVLAWIRNLKKKPRRIFVTHGEPAAAEELRRQITDQLKIEALVPKQAQTFDLDIA